MPKAKNRNRSELEKKLICEVLSITYDVKTQTGKVFMPDGNCVNFSTTVELFIGIDKDVKLIETFSGAYRDTYYRRTGAGVWDWSAHVPSRKRD